MLCELGELGSGNLECIPSPNFSPSSACLCQCYRLYTSFSTVISFPKKLVILFICKFPFSHSIQTVYKVVLSNEIIQTLVQDNLS